VPQVYSVLVIQHLISKDKTKYLIKQSKYHPFLLTEYILKKCVYIGIMYEINIPFKLHDDRSR
jgi:diketogulonate reductase-like aldo/keto reductase